VRLPIPADRAADVAAAVADVEHGLDPSSVAAKRARFGANAIVEEPRGRWRELARDTLRDPMIWFLLGTAMLYAAIGDLGGALVLLVAIVPLVGLDAWLHRRTRLSTQALRGRLATRVTVVRGGQAAVIPAVELVPCDLVRLHAGESFPADGLIVRGDGLQVDESALAGESVPVRKERAAAIDGPAVDAVHLHADDWLFAATAGLIAAAPALLLRPRARP